MEPIYTQDDVGTNLPEQRKIFDEFNVLFKKIMNYHGATYTTVQDFARGESFVTMVSDL